MSQIELLQLKSMLNQTIETIDQKIIENGTDAKNGLHTIQDEVKTSGVIQSILGTEWPLGIKQIHEKTKRLGKNCCYQAIFKALRELENKKIVEKNNKKYQLNKEWILETDRKIQKLKLNYEIENKTSS
ncbi:hypothetical protein KKE06_00905 [Candidatus Micrarchaeota archaeon]|nr:hypothetical protein [Candidatus Micrarchaeota archaeon]MBU1930766.1 hypothetical protein [Candidatus Micrarchaeota archaeon]